MWSMNLIVFIWFLKLFMCFEYVLCFNVYFVMSFIFLVVSRGIKRKLSGEVVFKRMVWSIVLLLLFFYVMLGIILKCCFLWLCIGVKLFCIVIGWRRICRIVLFIIACILVNLFICIVFLLICVLLFDLVFGLFEYCVNVLLLLSFMYFVNVYMYWLKWFWIRL